MVHSLRKNDDNKNETKRWNEIDVLYTLGTLLVVFGHSHSSDWNYLTGTILENIIMFIYVFHMPLFFFIAGFLFLNSISLKKNGFLIYIHNKALRLLTPYIVLSVLAMCPKYWLENGGFNGFSTYLIQALFIPRVGVWGHFWFLPALLLLYVLFGLWKTSVPDNKECLGLTVLCLVSVIIYFFPIQTNWFGWNDLKNAMVFFVLGMIIKLYLLKKDRIPYPLWLRFILSILGIIGSIILFSTYKDLKVIALLCGIIMVFVCWQIASIIEENKICRWISQNNYTIYIYSWPFQAVMMMIADKMKLPLVITTLSMFIVGILCPVLLIVTYTHIKGVRNYFFDLLLGVKRVGQYRA